MNENTNDEEFTLARIAKKAAISPAYAGWFIGSAFEGIQSKIIGAGMGMLFGASVTPLALETYENLSSVQTQQTYQADDATIMTTKRAPVTTPTQVLSGINVPLGIGYHALTREPEMTTTIEGSFSGPETTTFRPAFGEEILVETRTTNVNYTCRSQDDEWNVNLSQDLGSFNEPVTKRLEEHCKNIYERNDFSE